MIDRKGTNQQKRQNDRDKDGLRRVSKKQEVTHLRVYVNDENVPVNQDGLFCHWPQS